MATEQTDVLSMSDEDLLKMSPQEFLAQQEAKDKKPEEKQLQDSDSKEEEEEKSEDMSSEEKEEVAGGDDDYEEEELQEEEEEQQQRPVYAGTEEEEKETPEEDETEAQQEAAPTGQNGVDYKAEYERLLAPFRASKREIQVKSVDDARSFMQMGVDYQFKMQALKPKLRMLRALDKNGLLEEDKINFWIDLDKKNPEAIKKFIKDKEIDPMELDLESESKYQPNSYAPSEREQAIDDVLDSIRETESYERTIDELGNKWDEPSKEILTSNPQLIKLINDQIAQGIYDQIMNVVASERMLGRLAGLNDLMAYKTVGDALQASGAFDHLKKESKPKRKTSQDPKLKARKRAASPTKRSSSTASTSAKDFNPLALSDEEFEKMQMPRFA